MQVQQNHTSMFGDPIDLSRPNGDVFLLEQRKQSGVLRQCVRELDDITYERAGTTNRWTLLKRL